MKAKGALHGASEWELSAHLPYPSDWNSLSILRLQQCFSVASGPSASMRSTATKGVAENGRGTR
jgi:hypothetical protein